MTVCVAAVCNIRPGEPPFVVGASDRMITILDAEFEPRQTKQLRLASHTMGLFSGDMQVHAVVCPATMRNLSRLGLTHPQVKDIAEAYAEEFARYRRNQAERLYLTPVNLTVDTFITAGHTLDPNLASDLYRKMEKHVINAEAIICGRDETGAHLYKIIDPGEAVCFDTTCFVASGSRYDIAEAEFMFARFDKSLPHIDTIFLAYSAKRRAQAAAGVGEDTDLFAIGPNGITQVASEQLADLKKIWEKNRRGTRHLPQKRFGS